MRAPGGRRCPGLWFGRARCGCGGAARVGVGRRRVARGQGCTGGRLGPAGWRSTGSASRSSLNLVSSVVRVRRSSACQPLQARSAKAWLRRCRVSSTIARPRSVAHQPDRPAVLRVGTPLDQVLPDELADVPADRGGVEQADLGQVGLPGGSAPDELARGRRTRPSPAPPAHVDSCIFIRCSRRTCRISSRLRRATSVSVRWPRRGDLGVASRCP